MKTFGIILLIPIIFAMEILISVGTITLYMFVVTDTGGFLTKKLIDKL